MNPAVSLFRCSDAYPFSSFLSNHFGKLYQWNTIVFKFSPILGLITSRNKDTVTFAGCTVLKSQGAVNEKNVFGIMTFLMFPSVSFLIVIGVEGWPPDFATCMLYSKITNVNYVKRPCCWIICRDGSFPSPGCQGVLGNLVLGGHLARTNVAKVWYDFNNYNN